MINELQFRNELEQFQTRYQQLPYYMNSAYYWLGWGIKGNRVKYSYTFLDKLK